MQNSSKTKEQLINELEELRLKIETLRTFEQRPADNLQQSHNDLFCMFIDNFQGIAFQGTIDFVPMFFKGAVEKITGYKEKDFLSGNPNWKMMIHPDDVNKIMKSIENMRTVSDYSTEREYRIVRKDGEIKWIREFINNVADDTGKPILVQGTIYDITKRKNAEYALKQSEKKYRKFFQEDLTGDFITTLDGKILDCNTSFVNIFGFLNKKEALKKNITDLYPERKEREALIPLVKKRKKLKNYECIRLRVDGTPIHVIENIIGIFNDQGELTEIKGYLYDDTDRRNAEEKIITLNRELQQRVEELTEANKELAAFNATVSHDLRHPLVIIGGFTNRFLKFYGEKLDDYGKDILTIVKEQTQKMEKLIRDLLAFSRTGRQKLALEKIDIRGLVLNVWNEFKDNTEHRNINFTIKELPPAYADRILIQLVFVNLLSNAIKFTIPKSTALIEVGCAGIGDENIYYVKDNGIGFNVHDSEKMFLPFQRLPSAKDFEGTGIGLSIVERIIKRIGGRIWVEGKFNEGAVFYFTLPTIVR